jgi:hypothetical protein
VTIEKDTQFPSANEISLVTLEIQAFPGFFVEGPTKMVVMVFLGQKSVIPISFLPLIAGSTTLPPIILTHNESGLSEEQQTFSVPIVVTYTT